MPPTRASRAARRIAASAPVPRAAPGDHRDLTGQIPASPHHGAPLDNWISEYASNYWHNLPLAAKLGMNVIRGGPSGR